MPLDNNLSFDSFLTHFDVLTPFLLFFDNFLSHFWNGGTYIERQAGGPGE